MGRPSDGPRAGSGPRARPGAGPRPTDSIPRSRSRSADHHAARDVAEPDGPGMRPGLETTDLQAEAIPNPSLADGCRHGGDCVGLAALMLMVFSSGTGRVARRIGPGRIPGVLGPEQSKNVAVRWPGTKNPGPGRRSMPTPSRAVAARQPEGGACVHRSGRPRAGRERHAPSSRNTATGATGRAFEVAGYNVLDREVAGRPARREDGLTSSPAIPSGRRCGSGSASSLTCRRRGRSRRTPSGNSSPTGSRPGLRSRSYRRPPGSRRPRRTFWPSSAITCGRPARPTGPTSATSRSTTCTTTGRSPTPTSGSPEPPWPSSSTA